MVFVQIMTAAVPYTCNKYDMKISLWLIFIAAQNKEIEVEATSDILLNTIHIVELLLIYLLSSYKYAKSFQ